MRLVWLRSRLARTGPDDMVVLLRKVPIEKIARVVYGVGPKTVDALKEQGYDNVADLWDENDREARVPHLPLMGQARHWAVTTWVNDEAGRCETTARTNAARRAALAASIGEVEVDLAAPRGDTQKRGPDLE